jgi:ribonucleoside-triphosphate reductase
MKENSKVDSIDILSQVVIYNKYAKYLPNLKRREVWPEIVSRYLTMMEKKYPSLKQEIWEKGTYLINKDVLPSMRALQFAGRPIEKNNARLYNCSYLPIDDYRAFSEAIFLLLSGCGVGYSVQSLHVDKLPEIVKPNGEYKYLVGDNIEGWADSIKHLIGSYLGERKTKPRFDFSDIREKGEMLVTSGGKAPGPEPLKRCLFEIEQILENKSNGDKLKPIDVHSIMCHLANCVLCGGIRRSAMISLFDADNEEMLTCKSGSWWELNPHYGRSNNSAVLVRHKMDKESFNSIWKKIELSGSGEPGLFLTNNVDYGTNPCCEIALRHNCFCNLTTINASNITSQEELIKRVEAATFFGTLQAGFTDFHYLRPIWKKVAEKDSLLGVSMTGIASGEIFKFDIEAASRYANQVNKSVAKEIGINPSARITCIKPEGTASLVIGTSSGIHDWHDKFYIRRMQIIKSDDLYKFLVTKIPELIKDYNAIPNTAVLEIPIKAPDTAILRNDSNAVSLMERVKLFHNKWIKPSHNKGDNTHNVSATVSIKENEWKEVGNWMWNNRDSYTGLSVLPYDGGTYSQAPFETITEDKYNEMIKYLKHIDLSEIKEEVDNVNLSDSVACAGGACEIL